MHTATCYHSCEQSTTFASRVQAAGGRAELLPQALAHAQINAELGLPGAYTHAVDTFIASLLEQTGADSGIAASRRARP